MLLSWDFSFHSAMSTELSARFQTDRATSSPVLFPMSLKPGNLANTHAAFIAQASYRKMAFVGRFYVIHSAPHSKNRRLKETTFVQKSEWLLYTEHFRVKICAYTYLHFKSVSELEYRFYLLMILMTDFLKLLLGIWVVHLKSKSYFPVILSVLARHDN